MILAGVKMLVVIGLVVLTQLDDLKFGHIYVNPKRKVAVYFNPATENIQTFKVKIE